VDELGEHGVRPLYVAAFWGRVEASKVLVEAGADMEAKTVHGTDTWRH